MSSKKEKRKIIDSVSFTLPPLKKKKKKDN